MAIDINKDISYQLSINVLKALGGDTSKDFQSVEEVWDEINKIYDNAGDRLDIEALIMDIRNNGLYEFYPNENADAYAPVRVNVNVPQKYTDEYVEQLGREAFNEGKIEGEEIGYQKGFAEGSDDGYQDGYSEGLDDGAEEQKALLSEVTVKENGVYEREDGYKKVYVEVDIPTFETETLSVELTENGTHTYTPTADGYSSVEVSVNVDTPEPADLHILDIEVTENKSYEYTPTDYDGWKKVNLTVSVPTGGGGESPLTQLGYTDADISRINSCMNEDITHASTVSNPMAGSGQAYQWSDKTIVYAPWADSKNKTSMNGTFKECYSLREIPLYDTGNVLNLYETFSNCYALRSIPQLNTSKVTTMSSTFKSCYSLGDLPVLDTSSCTDMSYCFYYCKKLKQAPQWDYSKVSAGTYMFANSGIENVNINIPKVTSGEKMFQGCQNMVSAEVNVNNINSMKSMFYDCGQLSNVVINGYTKLVTSTYQMFQYCNRLQEGPYFDTENVTAMNYMFSDCTGLKSIPQYNTAKVTNMYNMLYNCTSLESVPELDCSSVTNISYVFGSYTFSKFTDFGGFKNLGTQSTLSNSSNYFITGCSNLTHDSLMNVINGLYDRASAGYSVISLRFGSTNLAKLTDEEKAIATTKGWSLAT